MNQSYDQYVICIISSIMEMYSTTKFGELTLYKKVICSNQVLPIFSNIFFQMYQKSFFLSNTDNIPKFASYLSKGAGNQRLCEG